ncbi:hypothetical protein D3C77_629730 [compost metagenome]
MMLVLVAIIGHVWTVHVKFEMRSNLIPWLPNISVIGQRIPAAIIYGTNAFGFHAYRIHHSNFVDDHD